MIPLEKEIYVRQLLKLGLSYRKIAKKAEVNRETVGVISKLPCLRKRKRQLPSPQKLKKPKKCPTCGGMIEFQECLLCWPKEASYDNDRPVEKRMDEESFFWDILELYKLNIIKHSLFMDLARRAKHILAKIRKRNAKKEEAAE